MSNIDKRALREAAEKATPGRIGDRVDGSIKYTCRGTDGTLVLSTDNHDDYGFVGDNSLEDELFFRLCDPVTVLALLDELEAKDKRITELEAKLETADKLQDSSFRHGLQHGFSLGQTDNQAGFEQAIHAYGQQWKGE